MSRLQQHAETELKKAGLLDKDSDYNGALGDAVMGLIVLLSEQGHSGASANAVIEMFERLSRFQPLSPLTGEDDEWDDVFEGVHQNKRCPSVFKDDTGTYDIEGRIFRKPSGACYVGNGSKVYVTFPYMPPEYVDV